MLAMGRAHVTGDYLQTAAIFDEDMNVLSKITDPNDYRGPGSGYAPSKARRAEMAAVRQQRSKRDLLDKQASYAGHVRLVAVGDAGPGSDPTEVCIGLSPALGSALWSTMAGIPVGEVIEQLLAGLEEEGCAARLVKVRSTIDLGMIGLIAARLAGSGIGIGLQAKGTALIHRSDLAPLACLELYSVAPLITPRDVQGPGTQRGAPREGLAPRSPAQPVHRGGDRTALSRAGGDAGRDRAGELRARRRAFEHGGAAMRFRALSGRPLEEITLDQGLAGNLGPADLRIHADTLRFQAEVAEQHGNVQLAENLGRAAELAGVDDADLLRVYEALRPRRATRDELEAIAAELDGASAPKCAAFVREAAAVYSRRGLTRSLTRSG